MLNEQVLLLSKKHGQLKQATKKMVQVVMGFLNETPNAETKLSVIETLRTVTEGKVQELRPRLEVLANDCIDLCRGREGSGYADIVRYEEGTG